MIKQTFNTEWTFEKDTGDSRLKSFYGTRDSIPVTLPYDAMIREKRDKECPSGAQSGFYPGGKYIYEKVFSPDDEWKYKDVFIEFEGVYGNTKISLNGNQICENHNGYVGFCVNIAPFLIWGKENTLKAEVDNSLQPNSRWYTGSGIYRDVNLWVGNSVCTALNSLRLTTKNITDNAALIEVETQINNERKNNSEIECTVEIYYKDECINTQKQEILFFNSNSEKMRMQFTIVNPELWSPESPALYECRVKLSDGDELLDETIQTFGIRIVSVNAFDGLTINGVPYKLRGTCIHHDNGIIGAECFSEAEEFRCKCLKDAGFNAIRSSHNPMSKAMLDACDRLGMLVMDELSDMWIRHKNPYDFADCFQTEYELWIKYIVEKDYNHPSVIMYSVGNEISEAGNKQGAYINRHLCNLFNELDNTRFTTNSLNALNCAGPRLRPIMGEVMQKFASKDQGTGSSDGSNALNIFMSLMHGEKGEYFAKHELVSAALEECSQSCDIIGLNYLRPRYILEKDLHPNKTVVGTETYPDEIEYLWRDVTDNAHVIGDFTWTGIDYIGEAGVGIFHYDGSQNFTSIYPERLAYIGDIDIIGNRRPISFFREIVFGLRKEPYIAVTRLEHNGQTPSKTAWMFKDNISSWTWTGFEGQEASVDVYSASEEVELFLNDCSLGRKPAGKGNHFTANYQVPYESGKLAVIGYDAGVETGRYEIETAEKVCQVVVEKVTDNEDSLIYLKANLADKHGRLNMQEKRKIIVKTEGNILLEGFGTANPSDEHDYSESTTETYDGFAMAAIRTKKGTSEFSGQVIFDCDGCQQVTIKL